MNIHKSYQPLNKNDIQEIESALNVILPNEYADFLLIHMLIKYIQHFLKLVKESFISLTSYLMLMRKM